MSGVCGGQNMRLISSRRRYSVQISLTCRAVRDRQRDQVRDSGDEGQAEVDSRTRINNV